MTEGMAFMLTAAAFVMGASVGALCLLTALVIGMMRKDGRCDRCPGRR